MLLIWLFLWTSPVFARFLHVDSDVIDKEELLSSEFYNDEISYQFPLSWERRWQKSVLGLMTSGGSYNKDRLMYFERIKVTSSEKEFATFSFNLRTKHDFLMKAEEKEFRVRLNSLSPVYFAAMIDTDSEKKWGDGGGALTYAFTEHSSIELYAWSVDHFYNAKKEFAVDRMEKPSRTYGTLVNLGTEKDFRARYHFEYDSPLAWRRHSQGYEYQYHRRLHVFDFLKGDIDQGFSWQLIGLHETKYEFKDWLDSGSKRLRRDSGSLDIRLNWAKEKDWDLSTGFIYIERTANYTNQNPPTVEKPSPDIARREPAAYITYSHSPTKSPKHSFQYGLFGNYVELKEHTDRKHRCELKPQLAWQYHFDDHASMFVNTTYDLDDLYDNFPYKGENKKFNPWGGGNLQFIAVF